MHVSMESTHALLFNFEAEIMIGDLKEFAFRRIIVFQNLKILRDKESWICLKVAFSNKR